MHELVLGFLEGLSTLLLTGTREAGADGDKEDPAGSGRETKDCKLSATTVDRF
jgi:hypothetical protein